MIGPNWCWGTIKPITVKDNENRNKNYRRESRKSSEWNLCLCILTIYAKQDSWIPVRTRLWLVTKLVRVKLMSRGTLTVLAELHSWRCGLIIGRSPVRVWEGPPFHHTLHHKTFKQFLSGSRMFLMSHKFCLLKHLHDFYYYPYHFITLAKIKSVNGIGKNNIMWFWNPRVTRAETSYR